MDDLDAREAGKTQMLQMTTELEELVLAGQVTAIVVVSIGPAGQQIRYCTTDQWSAIGMLATGQVLLTKQILG